MARKTKTKTNEETKLGPVASAPAPAPTAAAAPASKAQPKPVPKAAGRKVAASAQKRSKAPEKPAPTKAPPKAVNGHKVQLPAPKSAASAEPAPAPATPPTPTELAPAASGVSATWSEDGFKEVSSSPIEATIMQMDTPCEVCGKELAFGAEVLGRVASLTDGTIVRGKFRARCLEHGTDIQRPLVDGAPPPPTAEEREWAAVLDEAEMINEAIQGAMSVIALPENPPRRQVATYLCFLSAAGYAAMEMGIDYELAIENFADHYGEILEQRRKATAAQQASDAPPA